jgi:N-acetylmuramoyl-L-alanine amidase
MDDETAASLAASGSAPTILPENKYIKSINIAYDENSNKAVISFRVANKTVFMGRASEYGYNFHFMDRKELPIIYFEENDRSYIYFDNEKSSQNYFNYSLNGDILTVSPSFAGMSFGRIFNGDGDGGNIDFVQSVNADMTSVRLPRPAADESYGNFSVDTVMSRGLLFSFDRGKPERNLFGGDFTPEHLEKIKGMTVAVDAGHGGDDSGALYPLLSGINPGGPVAAEKDLNLDIALKLNGLLKDAGVNTVMTRTGDTFVELRERANIANSANADFFISVHNNNGTNPDKDGGAMMLYYPSPYATRLGISGEHAARILQRRLTEGIGVADRGVWKRPGLAVLSNTLMPAVLAEVSYLSDDRERIHLMDSGFRQSAAGYLRDGVIEVLLNIKEGMKREEVVRNIEVYVTREYSKIGRAPVPLQSVGFNLPNAAAAKCVYIESDSRNGNKYHLTIKVEYFAARTTEADLKDMRAEIRSVIEPVMGVQATNSIINQVARLENNTSHVFGSGYSGGGYRAQVSCMRYTGTCYIEIDKI